MKSLEDNYNYFLKADMSSYLGEWIAIVDRSVASHGKNAKQVYEEALKKFPDKRPLLTKVHGESTMIL